MMAVVLKSVYYNKQILKERLGQEIPNFNDVLDKVERESREGIYAMISCLLTNNGSISTPEGKRCLQATYLPECWPLYEYNFLAADDFRVE